MPATPLIGRADELDCVESFLADVERGPTALVLSGEAGIGKTIGVRRSELAVNFQEAAQ